ncbi:MAG: cob(I)yrinic acid a,c-diamide adenosyltransferase [Nanoarchaeota archaeon]|nr:cob(I)yrinic acid a,c-diamide adenosyltransferase [Nanoarchaeota archaeon]
MNKIRANGLNQIYFDKNISDFSNIAVGLVTRAISHSLRVAYVDVSGKASKFINFLENLSLSRNFVKKFHKLHLETFTFKEKYISKGIIPLVEFYNISYEMFWNSLKNFDLIIFDNATLDVISKYKIQNLLSEKENKTEIIFTFSKEKDFWEIHSNFDIVSSFVYNENSLLLSNKNITNIYGSGKGKTLYALGHMLRNFMMKEEVKFISFDKGSDYLGAGLFFYALKKWSNENSFYGTFDYVFTGLNRNLENNFRTENIGGDYREANEGLMLLNTTLRKQVPVVADELSKAISSNLLDIREVLGVLNLVENELVITGSKYIKKIDDISNRSIEVKGIKKNKEAKKGIDF